MLDLAKILKDHQRKSRQVRELRKKLKNSVTVAELKHMLVWEEKHEIDLDRYKYDDDDGYALERDEHQKNGRIQLLKKLIRNAERN